MREQDYAVNNSVQAEQLEVSRVEHLRGVDRFLRPFLPDQQTP